MKRKANKSPPQQPPSAKSKSKTASPPILRAYLRRCDTGSTSSEVIKQPGGSSGGDVTPNLSAYLRRCDTSSTSSELIKQPGGSSGGPEIDTLSAKRYFKTYLIRGNGEKVHVDTLRGKLIGLLLVESETRNRGLLPTIDLYNQLREEPYNLSHHFEIVHVLIPPDHPSVFTRATNLPRARELHYNLPFFTSFISTMPWLSIPFEDEAWRSHLADIYTKPRRPPKQLAIINQHGQLVNHCALNSINRYGPHVYPFTHEVKEQLRVKFDNLCTETSMDVLLASASNGGYLIDRNFNKVPISQLEGKHVALYHRNISCRDSDAFFDKLVHIYNQFSRDDFEIVFINFQYHGDYKDKKSFEDAVSKMPWLSLPFRDDNSWSLRCLLSDSPYLEEGEWYDYPTLFIRAKGETLLDPFGYHVIKQYGLKAYPFTRRAALRSDRRRLKEKLTFESFMKRAAFLGFSSLVRNKNDHRGEVENVSISDLNLQGKPRGILFLFASLSTFQKKALNSLINSYTKQKRPFSFEVIFVSLDKDTESFLAHFSAMPWFAFNKQLGRKDYKKLIKRTTKLDFDHLGHFIAFGPNGKFLRIGDLDISFDNRKFPFASDVEFMNFIALNMSNYTWDDDETFGAEDHLDWLDD